MRINTNISAMNALVNNTINQRDISSSLQKLSSGLRINSSADDAAGMTIADTLRSQGNTLGQAIKNGNDAIGIIQIADKAMDEQVKILDTIKVKATQAAQDGQNTASRTAIQNDIVALMAELDMIAETTSYNGMGLLNGSFTGKQFQVGAYSGQTVNISIGNTSSNVIGSVRTETTQVIQLSGATNYSIGGNSTATDLKIYTSTGSTVSIASVVMSQSAGTGLGALASAINKASDQTGVTASYQVSYTASGAVMGTTSTSNIVINNITIGAVTNVLANDSDGKLVNAINAASAQTGVTASIDITGRLSLTSSDGRGIQFGGMSGVLVFGTSTTGNELNLWSAGNTITTYGRLSLKTLGSNDIIISSSNQTVATFLQSSVSFTANLKSLANSFTMSQGIAMGAYANRQQEMIASGVSSYMGVGVTTRVGAMMAMDIAESALKQLDKIRASLGSAQNQVIATVNNISVTQVNVAAAESQIRDVDFAQESSNFSKRNILAQSGSYALSQANQMQQNVLRLLQ